MLKTVLIDKAYDKVKFKLNSILSQPIEVVIGEGVTVSKRITLNPGQDEFEISRQNYTYYLMGLIGEGIDLQREYDHVTMPAPELLEKYGLQKDEANRLVDKNDYGHDILLKIYKAYSNEKDDDKRLEYARVLKELQRYYNDNFIEANIERSCKIVNSGIFIVETLDDADIDNIEIDGKDIIHFNGQKTIKRRLDPGIHLIYVYNDDHELLQRFFYVGLRDEDNKIFDQEYANRNELMDSIVTEEDEVDKILQIMNYFDIDMPIFPIPKIGVNDDENLDICIFPEQAKNYSVLNAMTFTNNTAIRLCLSEIDELFNKNANYRSFLYTPRNSDADNHMTWFYPQLNKEKYFYWLEDNKGNKLSTIGIFDPTGEDVTNYNLLFAQVRFHKHYNEYMKRSDYQDKIHALLEEIRNDEDLPYLNVVEELRNKIALSVNTEKEAWELINYCENCLDKYTKKFDHKLLEPIIVRNSYKQVLFNAKSNEGLYLVWNDIDYTHNNACKTNHVCVDRLKDTGRNICNGVNRICVARILDTIDWTVSRPIVVCFDKNSRIKYINTNGLEKEVIDGL